MQVLIIEDELPASRQLEKILSRIQPDAQVLEVLDSVDSSVRWLRAFRSPDLIFMDIQIADGLSFEIFRQVEVRAPVIFTTAFDAYAIQAFRVNAVDYLLKPVEEEALAEALGRVRAREQQGPLDVEALRKLLVREPYKTRFLVKSGQQMLSLEVAEIAYFRSSDGLTQAHTASGKKYFVEHSLEELESLVDPAHYFRVSRGLSVRADSIKAIHPHLNGRLKLDIQPAPPEPVFVSRERVGAFKVWLGG